MEEESMSERQPLSLRLTLRKTLLKDVRADLALSGCGGGPQNCRKNRRAVQG